MAELSRDLVTGVGKIDDQHKELISRINAVAAMGTKAVSADETRKTIDFLGEYIIKHFGDEESLQRQVRYPHYDEHKQLHQAYIKNFRDLQKEFREGGMSAKFTVTLNSSITNWIINHIKVEDVKFAKHYKENTK